jgi:hypothetical protein
MAKVVERVERGVGDGPDRAAVSSVSSGRSALRHALLAAKRDTPVAAVAGLDVDFGGVDEQGS